MSFTVKCDDCQTEEKFTEEVVGLGDYDRGDKIIIYAEGYPDGTPPRFGIECKVCNKEI